MKAFDIEKSNLALQNSKILDIQILRTVGIIPTFKFQEFQSGEFIPYYHSVIMSSSLKRKQAPQTTVEHVTRRSKRNKEAVLEANPEVEEIPITPIDDPGFDKVLFEGWLEYDKNGNLDEEIALLLEERLRSKHPNEIRELLKVNSQLQTGTAKDRRRRIAEGVVFGFNPACPKCHSGTRPILDENSVFKGYSCGGGYDQTVGRVTSCGIIIKRHGTKPFVSPYPKAYKYLNNTGKIGFIPSFHADQQVDGRAGELYRRMHKGKNY